MDRRNFFKNSGRWVLLSGFGLFAGYLAVNNRIAERSDCEISPVCNNCGLFAGCSLPQANKQRSNGR